MPTPFPLMHKKHNSLDFKKIANVLLLAQNLTYRLRMFRYWLVAGMVYIKNVYTLLLLLCKKFLFSCWNNFVICSKSYSYYFTPAFFKFLSLCCINIYGMEQNFVVGNIQS